MTDCLNQFLWEKLPYFFAEPVLLALFLVELRWLSALRGRGMGTLAFYMWQYASTLALCVLLYLPISAEPLVYIPGVTDCLMAYERRYGWIFGLGLGIPILGLALTSYAACAVLEDKACKILMPILVLRTLVAGLFMWGAIVALSQKTSLWLPVIMYFALFATYYVMHTRPR